MLKVALRLLCCMLCFVPLGAQEKKALLSPESVMDMVRKNHPVARQAALLNEDARANLLSARGGFDPVFDLTATRKTFDGKNYYFYNNPEIQLPTAAAFTVKAGWENNGGENIFSESTRGRSSYLGVEMPLASGLLLDKRRAALQMANLLISQSEQDRRKVVNNLMLDAYTSYWQWASTYRMYQIYGNFVTNAEKRFRLLKIAYFNGDRSVMDTVEALSQLQQYRLARAEALGNFNNAAILLSNYLWLPGDSIQVLAETYVPDTTRLANYQQVPVQEELIVQAMQQHPEIQSSVFKIKNLETERKLKFQGLLPYVGLKANILSKDYGFVNSWDAGYISNNYKWGLTVTMPLLLRQGRGDYTRAKIKIKDSELELVGKKWLIESKIRFYYVEIVQYLQQIALANDMVENYRKLLRNEELKFEQGESSLFLINSRENKLLEIMEKQLLLWVKYQSASYKIQWAAGLLQ